MLRVKTIPVILVMALALLLLPTVVLAQPASEIAHPYRELLDTYTRVIDTVSYNGTAYYVINYYNVFPYASGIEIISVNDSSRVSDPGIAKSILMQTAWKKATAKLSYHDIAELNKIINTTQGITAAIAPIKSATRAVTAKLSALRSTYIFGESAFSIVKGTYPAISTLDGKLELLTANLNEWEAPSRCVTNNLSKVIRGVDAFKAGKELDPELPQNIQVSLSAIETLERETRDIDRHLSNASSTLYDARYGLNSAAKSTSDITTIGGSLLSTEISAVADTVGNLNTRVDSLKADVLSITDSLSGQRSRLSNVVEVANTETDKLYSHWSTRRKATVMVYSTLGGIIAVVSAILSGVLIYVMGSESFKSTVKTEGVTGGWDTRRITGVIITAVGLLLLLYSFITAYNFCIGEFRIDESFIVRIILLSCMIGIGVYLTEKGAILPERSLIMGTILAIIGLLMLGFSFMVANTFVRGEFIFDELLIVKIIFLLCMVEIGGYLTGRGVTLTATPKVTGAILTPIGVVMLVFSFITASTFVSGEFMPYGSFVIVLLYFICMIGIGGYLTGRGVAEILKSQEIL